MDSKFFSEFAHFAITNSPDGAFLISRDASIVYANKTACDQLGYTEQELPGLKIMDINPHLTREIWDAVWGVTVSETFQTIETEHRTKDGRLVPMEVLANFVTIDGEQFSCTFTRDIAERKSLEVRARQRDKMEAIGQLAGGIAHDFNNQLGGIMGFADILREHLKSQPELMKFIDGILAAAQNSASLTKKLLAFSRQGKCLSIPVNLHQCIDETVTILQRSVNKKIKIKRSYNAASAYIAGDPSQMENALLNLAINARDAMPDGGAIHISTNVEHLNEKFCSSNGFELKPGAYVKLEFRDTGVGMTEEVLNQAFEPFFTTRDKGKGTGLGLASVYGSVKNHQGAVFLSSKNNAGTTATLYLPQLDPADATLHSKTRPPTAVSQQLDSRVLVIDDEPVIVEITTKMLTSFGCHVTAFTSAAQAIDYYRDAFKNIDAVVMDLMMPDMDGDETYAHMKKINPRVRVLACSGYSNHGVIEALLNKGVNGYLPKPFRKNNLYEALTEILM